LKVDNLSRERMCVGSEFQVDGAETENARAVKLLVMPVGLASESARGNAERGGADADRVPFHSQTNT